MHSRAGHALEIRQRIQGEVHFPRRSSEFVSANFVEKVRRQISAVDEFDKRMPWVHAGRNHAAINLIAIGQRNSNGPAILHDDLRHRRLFANFYSSLNCGFGDGVRNSAGAAAGESPGAECAVDFSHIVVQQNVCRARTSARRETSR